MNGVVTVGEDGGVEYDIALNGGGGFDFGIYAALVGVEGDFEEGGAEHGVVGAGAERVGIEFLVGCGGREDGGGRNGQ